ncbi:hypothetical protein G3A44_18105 [Ideonella sp. TBM-1]|uniref:Uncharacterized protein n=1 Tax=Ideonella livida TaxID=2707176 RepID=A0A7C9PJB4_9BURK|nr:hypothetical protein [Ideonella livida]
MGVAAAGGRGRSGAVVGLAAALGLALGVVLGAGALRLQPAWGGLERLHDGVPASYIGVLSDAQGRAALLVSSRRQGRQVSLKLLQPLPAGQVARLWALPEGGGAPFVVGELPTGPLQVQPVGAPALRVQLTLDGPAEARFAQVTRLAVVVSPPGVAAADAPPVEAARVWQGHCAKLW